MHEYRINNKKKTNLDFDPHAKKDSCGIQDQPKNAQAE